MKKIFVFFAIFATLIFVVSCGGGSKSVNQNDEPDTGETVNDEDSDTADSGSTDNPDSDDSDSDNPDTEPTDTGEPDTAPDGGDTAPVPDGDNGDSTPDNGDTEPDNDYPQTPCDPNPCISDANSTGVCAIKNDSYVCSCKSGYIFDGTLCIKSLPECSPTSDTPCIVSATGLIWSAKSENKMPWNDAVNYCQNLTEGDFNDWRLPSIAVLKTLVQNCSSAKCSDDYTGKYSKFGDTVYLWSSSEGEDSTAQSIYFSDAGTYSVSTDTNVNVRCVRREAESRESNCTGLIENSVWNTATQITQTWDWETAGWTPSPQGSYNTEGSTSECRFKCDSNSFREGSKCLNPCKPNPCNSIGETGTCLSKSAIEYSCECKDNYFWDGSSHCLNPCNPNMCDNIGETGTCLSKNAIEYRCECEENYFWNGSSRCLNPCNPNPCTSIGETGICIGTSANEHRCECESNYVWIQSSNKCMKNHPCLKNPCNIPNSTGTCDPVSETQYVCECKENYYWWGEKGGCTTQKPGLGNICTGQISCYKAPESLSISCPTSSSDDFYGQDAQYAALGKCTPQSFTVRAISGDNIIVDNNTGLIWEKSPSSLTYTWNNANNHCADLNISNYGGRSNWRVPNPLEFMTIFDNSRSTVTNYNFTNMPPDLWTSKEYDANHAYNFRQSPTPSPYPNSYDYYYHYIFFSEKSNTYKVLCVSGDEMQPATSADFTSQTISGKVVVTDSKTGLMWQKEYETSTKKWQKALSYCEGLNYAGYSDWRLPNINELASLLNYEKSGAPYSYFPNDKTLQLWSSTTDLATSGTALGVSFDYGIVDGYNKTDYSYVRCVR